MYSAISSSHFLPFSSVFQTKIELEEIIVLPLRLSAQWLVSVIFHWSVNAYEATLLILPFVCDWYVGLCDSSSVVRLWVRAFGQTLKM